MVNFVFRHAFCMIDDKPTPRGQVNLPQLLHRQHYHTRIGIYQSCATYLANELLHLVREHPMLFPRTDHTKGRLAHRGLHSYRIQNEIIKPIHQDLIVRVNRNPENFYLPPGRIDLSKPLCHMDTDLAHIGVNLFFEPHFFELPICLQARLMIDWRTPIVRSLDDAWREFQQQVIGHQS